MPLLDVSKQLLLDEAVKALREAILKGRFQPGERLLQTRLAEMLGISRTPIREALQWLEREGLVRRAGRQGMVVAQLLAKDIEDMYDVREVLDGLAARLAAQRASPSQLAALRRSIDKMAGYAEKGEPQKWLQTNQSFHDTLARAARNERLMRTLSAVHTSLHLLFPFVWSQRDRPALAYREHLQIYEALVAREPEEAERLARAHAQAVKRVVLDALSSQPPVGLERGEEVR